MTWAHRLVSSGSPLEPEIGFSRAVRSGPHVCVAGTAPIAQGGGTAAPGDVYAQSVRCLDIAEQALRDAGASPASGANFGCKPPLTSLRILTPAPA
jgi:enamine deaminase RidA (YjgF/YER057c/UK114 family)